MRSLPSLLLALLLLAPPLLAHAAEAETGVGLVSKVENEAHIVSASGATIAIIGAPVHMKDELRTGAKGRLQVTFVDHTLLTLGENASVAIDAYVFDPDHAIGEMALQAAKGAFRFVTGRIKELSGSKIRVSTPVAAIAVRGTEFWGGPIDAKYGVLLLEGEVVVSNQAGSVTLSAAGQGTNIASPNEAPGAPSVWPQEKVARAIATVALH
jgi:hypothetical protein